MRILVFLILFLHTICINAQHYKHIGVENGLSSRKVYSLLKDRTGYMWFLTHEGIDRYDGKEFKHYNLTQDGKEISSLQDLNWFYICHKGDIWQIGKKGRVFRYNPLYDTFEITYQLPPQEGYGDPTPISYSFIDDMNMIWLCGDKSIHIFNPESKNTTIIPNDLNATITYAVQHDDTHYFIGTETGIHYVQLKGDKLNAVPVESMDSLSLQINELYLDETSNQLFIGTFQRGVYIFDLITKNCEKLNTDIADITVMRIKSLNQREILVATDGAGVYKVNTLTREAIPYIVADYNDYNRMNGNNINDFYIDAIGRIWLANYPIGITIRDDRYSHYKWIRHSIGNTQSLINDRVNGVVEDHDGDLWFATSNGISLYHVKTGEWSSFLSSFNAESQGSNHNYMSICEAMPGTVLVAGYSSTVYKIDKKSNTVSALSFGAYTDTPVRPDKYIQAIRKDSQGYIWIGGHYNLKRINLAKQEMQLYPDLNNITTILEKDKDNMWIGTGKGLYLLNKTTGESRRIITPIESNYIYSLCQSKDRLYIGTNGAGLLIFNLDNEVFSHFHKNNSALLSNNIYSLLSDDQDNIVFSSESGLTRLYPRDNDFHNWTKEQGLKTSHFNQNSGVLTKSGKFIFGSTDGAVEFDKDMQLPREYDSKLVLSDFKLFYESVFPGRNNSPLRKDINETETLQLNYNQNIFSLKVSSINYDYPSNTLYSWKLEGFYDNWSRPGQENIIRFTNLSPGDYTLRIRAHSNESRQILEERYMKIIVAQPFWRSTWAFFGYLGILGILIFFGFRLIYMRKQRRVTQDKFQFFINTAHDIRTPLTLIKAPLEEVQEKESLSEVGMRNMNTAIRNVNVLLRLTTNLINFERMDLYSSDLYISEYELNTFLRDIVQSFNSFAEVKKIKLTYESNFLYLNVWFDKEKMESVFKNIISNALKYTPEGGSVDVYASESVNSWDVEVRDTGIGIPASEQKNVFKSHFRGSNAINSKVTGSGIGMVLVGKQVEFHKGKISLNSVEHKGTTIKVSFPKGYEHFKKAHIDFNAPKTATPTPVNDEPMTATFNNLSGRKKPKSGQRILVVEDNDELRAYLRETLSEDYVVQTCENGKEALYVVKEYMPDLVISDIMMPEMQGDELCEILKNDIETSHIPIILLTALNDEKHVVQGLRTGADEYIIKPFNISILKATIANILTNRALLRSRYANLEIEDTAEEACNNCSTDIDWKFIAELKSQIEEHMDDPQFNIDVLAADMNMSRTSLYNKIKALTDLSPSDYVRTIRLTKAAELLLEGELNVTEVAERTGFNDAKYFREVFKKQYKVSPSKFKGEK